MRFDKLLRYTEAALVKGKWLAGKQLLPAGLSYAPYIPRLDHL